MARNPSDDAWDPSEDGPPPTDEELFLSDIDHFRESLEGLIEHYMKLVPYKAMAFQKAMQNFQNIAIDPSVQLLEIQLAGAEGVPPVTIRGDPEHVLSQLQAMLLHPLPAGYQKHLLYLVTALEAALSDTSPSFH